MVGMASLESHLKMYRDFKKAAENESIDKGPRAEMYFLAAYHLIEACAAKKQVHINKHQLVRKTLEEKTDILGTETKTAWTAFQFIENNLRPKFVYGGGWEKSSFDELKTCFNAIEAVCLRVLENE